LKRIKSTILLILTAMIWGFAFVAQRYGSEHLGAFSFNGIRFMMGAISLIPVILIFEKDDIKDTKKLKKTFIGGIFAGLALFCASSLQQMGVEMTQSAGKSAFITGLYTVIVPVASFILFKKRTNICTWLGVVFAVTGLYLISLSGKTKVELGDLVLLLGTIFWATHILVIDHFVNDVSPLKFACTQFFVCSILGLIFAFSIEHPTFESVKMATIPLLYSGIMSAGVAYTCQILGQKDSDPTVATIIMSTESLFAAIGGAVILKETMTMRGYIGCAIMFAGIIISQLEFKKKEKQKSLGI